MLFAGACAPSNSLSSSPASCVPRTCLNFYSSIITKTTNSSCGQWLAGCISNGNTGCLAQFKQAANGASPPYPADLDICSNYQGTSTTCGTIIANNNPATKSGVQCWSTSSTVAPCIVKTVNNILQNVANQIWNDQACQSQLTGTVSTQVSVAVGQPGVCALIQSCSSYTGTFSYCTSMTGTSGKCTKLFGFCYPKLVQNCTSLVGTYIGQCQKYSNTCTWVSSNNCSTLGSCVSYVGIAINCNAVTDAYGLPCGSNSLNNASAAGAACIQAQWCTDYNTGPTPTTSIAYCQKLKDAIGNTCTAASNQDANCSYSSQITYALGVGQCSNSLTTVKNGKCTAIQLTNTCAQYLKTNATDCATMSAQCTYVSGNACTSITYCSITSPTFNSISSCAAISSLCTYIPGTGCSLIQACSQYTIPGSYSSNAQMMQFCLGLSNGTNNCLYDSTNAGVCSNGASGACSSYTNSSTSLTLTNAICLQFQNASNKPCGFTSGGNNCIDPISCSTITAPGTTLVGAQTCSAQIDSSTLTPCSVSSTQSTCQPGQTTCTAYRTINTNNTDNASQCQSYFIAGGQKCGYVSGTTCSNRTCSDLGISQANCNSYIGLTCVWTGSSCVNASSIVTCSQIYGLSTAACSTYTDKFGRQCWWTSSAQCSDYQCSSQQTGSTATHALCQSLNAGCTVLSSSGMTCQTVRSSCFSYTPASMSDCAFMYDSANIPCVAGTTTRCTYATVLPTVGSVTQQNCLINPAFIFTAGATAAQNTCTGTSTIVNCSTKSVLPNQSFQQSLAYCQSLTSVIYGTPCFFSQFTSAGVLSTMCVDSVLSLNTPNCPAANVSNGTSTIGNGSDADCAAFSTGCTSTIASATASSIATQCSAISCLLAPASTSQLGCTTYNSSCVWNGSTGCVSNTTQCTALFGTVATCALLNGGFGSATYAPCFQSIPTATTTPAACSYATCSNAPLSITNNAGCELWWPSKYNANYNSPTQVNLNCVWTGTTGCVTPQQCYQFTGNGTVCSQLIATDGPCKYVSGNNCTPLLCTDAPNNYTTDAQCSVFTNSSQQCITTGYGCISRVNLTSCSQIVNQTSCSNSLLAGTAPYSKSCAWLPTCVASVTNCTDSSLSNPTLCTTTPVQGQTCVWNVSSCQAMTCLLLPSTLTNHAACVAALPLGNCTTSGAGCIPCSSYTQYGPSACQAANNQELPSSPQITKCIWANNQCRVIKCSDNTTATTNELCNQNQLTGCITTGQGCVQIGQFQCSNLITAAACLVDGQGGPCLWINNSCQSFTGCQSIAYPTHAQCQKIIVSSSTSPQCTSNGVNCIALTSCANYISNSVSCVISNQGNICGLLPANSKGNTNAQCQNFSSCTDAQGTTNDQCALYGSQCISNGVNCQTISTCNSYTQSACQNNPGTDGKCFWVAVSATVPTGLCRTQQCSDANTTNSAGIQTDSACAQFPAPFINSCTTNGTGCIPRTNCASYNLQLSCVMGTDGGCIWIPNNTLGQTTGNSTTGNSTSGNSTAGTSTPQGTCRVQQCSDAIFTTSSACAVAIIASPTKTTSTGGVITTTPQIWLACVSNGVTCIPRSTCSSYTSYAACQGGGTDGNCAFNNGTCTQMTSCSIANTDQIACQKASDRCFWNGANNSTTCTTITCAQASAGGTCKPVPAFNYLSYQVCAPVSAQNSTCIPADSSANPAISCFSGSLGQSTWNDTAQNCTQCQSTATNNNSGVNNTNTTSTSISTILLLYGAILSVI